MSTETKLPQALVDIGKPSLHALSYALRHPDTWPEDFYWDFSDCEQCAMGLAHRLWGIQQTKYKNGASIMARSFAMPYTTAYDIFYGSNNIYTEPRKWLWGRRELDAEDVTPEMVADKIDQYLASVE